jgi:uncharacterized membrane protein
MMGMWGWGWPMMLFTGLFWILLLVGAGFLVYALVARSQALPPRVNSALDDPLKALKMRYARGEITHEQFDQIRQDIDDKAGDQR